MGFFSWDCPCCGHSIRHRGATNATSEWLSKATAVFPNGDHVSGTYDGYGNLGRHELDFGADFALYHTACWKLMGKPEYTKASESARDQGHFVGEYDPAEPKTLVDVAELLKQMALKREQDRQAALAARQKMRLEKIAKGEPIPDWLKD